VAALKPSNTSIPLVVSLVEGLKPGLKCVQEFTVGEEHTASHVGSGTVRVLSTPSMIAFMEIASLNCVQRMLGKDETTVGTMVCVKHLAPAPVGATVRVETELVRVEGRRLLFHVKAWWGDTLIGEGEHERYIVNVERFLAKVRRAIEEGSGKR
jgi:predicted thioesterase